MHARELCNVVGNEGVGIPFRLHLHDAYVRGHAPRRGTRTYRAASAAASASDTRCPSTSEGAEPPAPASSPRAGA